MKKLLLPTLIVLLTCTAASAQNCQANVYPASWANGQTTLMAVDSASTGVVAYLWNTGAITAEITVSDPGEYCCTITFSDGCTASSCYELPDECWVTAWWYWVGSQVYITAWSGPTYLEESFLWSNGATTNGFLVDQGGAYCVTVTKENGCTATTCIDVPLFNPDTLCEVNIEVWHWPDSTVQLNALSNATGVTFAWNTGETGPSILPSGPGEYCVVATSASGCTASNCINLYGPTCEAYVYASWPDTGVAELTVWGNAPFNSYAWSNGSTSPSITVIAPGEYCVTVMTAEGCETSACFEMPGTNYMTVFVQMPDSLEGINAEVFIIRYDTAQGGILTALDTVQTNSSGYVLIENLPAGEYLVKAALLPGAPNYQDYLPTYYDQVLFWNEATPVVIYPASPLTYGPYVTIFLQAGDNPGGPGFIGGLVSEGANFGGSGDEERGEGDPMAGVQVVLRRDDGTPVTATRTNVDGTFAFNGLAWGTYQVSIDLPGIEPVHQWVTIGPDQPSADAVHFTVDGLASTSVSAAPAAGTLAIQPNPATDRLTVTVAETPGRLTLTDTHGRVVLQREVIGQSMELDVQSLPQGLYWLSLHTGRRSITAKVVKQ